MIIKPSFHFKSVVPKQLGKVFGQDNWQGITLPALGLLEMVLKTKLSDAGVIKALTKMLQTPTQYPVITGGMFFDNACKNVEDHLIKHELTHWAQFLFLCTMLGNNQLAGAIFYYLITILNYEFFGYNKSWLEQQAYKAQKLPFTAQEKIWVVEARKVNRG